MDNDELIRTLRDAVEKNRVVVPLDKLEQQHVHRVVEQCHDNMSRAAELLGITRQTLYRKLKTDNCPQTSNIILHDMTPYSIIAFLIVILAVIILWEWRRQRRLSIRARLMREALRNRDFMYRLPTDGIMPGERDLQTMVNDMGGEINQLMARSEVESWQRLTRVLTHVIMNAVTPTPAEVAREVFVPFFTTKRSGSVMIKS